MNNSAYTCVVVDAAKFEQSIKRPHLKVSFSLLLDIYWSIVDCCSTECLQWTSEHLTCIYQLYLWGILHILANI